MRRALLPLIALALLAPGFPDKATSVPAPELWFYQATSLADASLLPRTEALWRRAAAAGYSRVVLADARFERPSAQDAGYLKNVAHVRALADSLHLEIVPGVFTIGREQGALLAEDPDLAEALPVRDALFEVHGGIARLVPDPPVALPATLAVSEGNVAFADGVARIDAHEGRVRFGAAVAIAPWRCYHLSVEIRTSDYTGDPQARVTDAGEALSFARLGVQRTQDWTRHHVMFCSLAHSHATITLGDWHGARGRLEWRDAKLEEAGPVNLVRRASTPFTIAGRVEGRDFEPVRDSLMGRSPWAGQYDVWHEPPVIRTRLPDGTRLRASWYQAAVLLKNQVAACPSDSETLARLADEGRRVRALFGARTMMLMHDEIRALGWDPACMAGGHTAGEILAANVRACRGFVAPARACVWNDMFDPAQNAVPNFYQVRGDLAGSWAGLDPDVIVVNWNLARLPESLRFFAARGHEQVIAGYYDGRVDDARAFRPLIASIPRITGVMYTTWQERYDDLEAFAQVVRGER